MISHFMWCQGAEPFKGLGGVERGGQLEELL
jgi:hypothetical protein